MDWVYLGIISLFFLGAYDIVKKNALQFNAVLPVLFLSCLASALFVIAVIIFDWFSADTDLQLVSAMVVTPLEAYGHYFLKAIIVVTSWVLSFLAIKHLPLTIVSPIRSTGPFWALIGAIVIFHEQLSVLQWSGLTLSLVALYAFTLVGAKEGIVFRKNKWVLYMLLATIIGTISTLYDKYLVAQYDRLALQAYFTFFQVLVLLPVVYFFWYRLKDKTPIKWKLTIPLIGLSLLIADYAYFMALNQEGSSIAILSALRRSSVIVTFVAGGLIFKEKNKRLKGAILIFVLIGIYMIIQGS